MMDILIIYGILHALTISIGLIVHKNESVIRMIHDSDIRMNHEIHVKYLMEELRDIRKNMKGIENISIENNEFISAIDTISVTGLVKEVASIKTEPVKIEPVKKTGMISNIANKINRKFHTC